jgi:hypothetical protein
MDDKRTEFDYLLNALELASQSAHPSQEGYGDKRLALFAYVRKLEAPTIPADVGRRAMEALNLSGGWVEAYGEPETKERVRSAITELQQYLGEKK